MYYRKGSMAEIREFLSAPRTVHLNFDASTNCVALQVHSSIFKVDAKPPLERVYTPNS